MPPGAPDLHIDQALSSVSVAYYLDPNDFIADKMFPGVPSGPRSNMFNKYNKSDWRRTDAEKRAPGTQSAGISWTVDRDRYFAEVYAAHVDIDAQTRANSDDDWKLDSDATKLVTQHLLIQKDVLWADTYFKTGIWGTEYAGIGSGTPTSLQFLRWNLSSSDPLANFSRWRTDFRLNVGKKVNRVLFGADVWVALENHPAILDRIKFTERGVVTEELVASFLGVDKVMVAYSSVGTGPKLADAREADAAASYEWTMDPKAVLFGYAPKEPSQFEPSMGYTFNWKGYGAGNKYGLSMGQFYMKEIKSDRIEGEAAYDQKLVSADCGVFLRNAVD